MDSLEAGVESVTVPRVVVGWGLRLEAWVVLHLVKFFLTVSNLYRLSRMLSGLAKLRRGTKSGEELRILGRSCEAAARWASSLSYRSRKDCLPRALTTTVLLVRRGVVPLLCIGVKRFPLEAHAWVESDRQLLGETEASVSPYTTIASLVGEEPRCGR